MPERNALIAWLITERPLGVNCNSEKSGMAIAETEALLTRIESAGSFSRATDRCRAWANPSRSTRCPVGTDVRRCGTTCRRASDRHVAISASDGRVEGSGFIGISPHPQEECTRDNKQERDDAQDKPGAPSRWVNCTDDRKEQKPAHVHGRGPVDRSNPPPRPAVKN